MSFLALALLLGVKHSFDADHLLAVSNLLARVKSPRQAAIVSFSWAVGHLLTATAVALALFFFREPLLPLVLGKFELLVGAMLVLLGVVSLGQVVGLIHLHTHSHDEKTHGHVHAHWGEESHLHKHMFGVGVVQGLASNDELLVLVTSTLGLNSLAEIILAVVLFSVGVVAGMLAYSLLLASVVAKARKEKPANAVNAVAGVLSIAYGTLLLAGAA